MAKQSINVGTTANDKKGDSLRAAFQKVNSNFTELYTALGLNDTTLNLGAFTFTGSTMSTDDSTNIVIDKPITVNGEIVVDGDIVPKTNLGASLGTPTRQFKSLYVSTNTIYINNVPLSLDPGTNTLKVNNLPISQRITYTDIPNAPTDISDLTDNTNLLGSSVTASSSTSFTNKTINIAFGQGNTFQIQGNSITSYSGSGAVVALTNLPTLNGINVNNSSLTIDGGTGNYYWKPTSADGTGTIHKAGIYKSNPDTNNALFTFGANGTGTMSVQIEGSMFVGNTLPNNNSGVNTDFGGWLVVQSGGKFGGDVNTLGRFILDSAENSSIVFGDATTQTTAYRTTKLITHTANVLVVATSAGDGSLIAITDNHQTESVSISNSLGGVGRATLPNITSIGKVVILTSSAAHETYVDRYRWPGNVYSYVNVSNSANGVVILMSLGSGGWKQIQTND
jgi:hypothetical protein